MALTGPEHLKVRLPVIERLKVAGWRASQMQWQPEWSVPKRPSEAKRREDGRSFEGWPVDLVLFQDTDGQNDWQNVLGIFEFKAPTENAGLSQLEIYLGLEPRARFGVWTNGSRTAMLFKLPDGTFKTVRYKELVLPCPGDDFEQATSKAITFDDLVQPTEQELKASFKTMLDVVVARDTIATRSEMHLEQLCNLLLLKLESDTNASLKPSSPVAFQLQDDEGATARHIREAFDLMVEQRDEVFRDEFETSLSLDSHTIKEVVYAWSGWNLLDMQAEAVSAAFQVFRRANLKAGEGQYYTPARIIRAAIKLIDIQPDDKIIDPACGTSSWRRFVRCRQESRTVLACAHGLTVTFTESTKTPSMSSSHER